MVSVREQQGATRYALLETVRQYAARRLAEPGEEEEVRGRYVRHVLDLVLEAEPHLTRADRRAWVDRLVAELENLRETLAWSRDHDPMNHLRLVGALWWFWYSTRHWGESGRWIDGALELPEATAPTHERAALLFAAGALGALRASPDPAREQLAEAAELAAATGDDRLAAYATNYLGLTYAGEGRSEAMELCRRAADWFQTNDDLYGLRLAFLLMGSTAMATGDLHAAERLNARGVEIARQFATDRARSASLEAGFRTAMGDAAFQETHAAGQELTPEAAVELALTLMGSAPAVPVTARPIVETPKSFDLEVDALGPFSVRVQGRPVQEWSYAKPRELLVFLLCHPDGGTRDRIARALWPEADGGRLKNSFHVTLHYLRKTLDHPDWIVLRDDRYTLTPGISVAFDADRFEDAARNALMVDPTSPGAEAALREPLALYRGDLLDGEVFGAWVDETADRLRRLHTDLSLALGSALEHAGDYDAAIEIYQAIAAREDLNEDAHRRLMACWARTGDRVRALRHYDRMVALLRETLEADPEPETARLADRIRAAALV